MIRTINTKEIPNSWRNKRSVIRERVQQELDALQKELAKHPLAPYEAKVITLKEFKNNKPQIKNVMTVLLKETKQFLSKSHPEYGAFSRTNPENHELALYVTPIQDAA